MNPDQRTEEQQEEDHTRMVNACMSKAREVMPAFADRLQNALMWRDVGTAEDCVFDVLWNLGDMIHGNEIVLEEQAHEFNGSHDLPNPHHFKEVVQAVLDVMREDQQFYTPKATDFQFVAQNIFSCYTPTEVSQ